MPVSDYCGIEGFAVDAKSAQDVYEAIDGMHTQILDEIAIKEAYVKRHFQDGRIIYARRVEVEIEKVEQLKATQRILETAMESLLEMDGVGA